MESGRIDHTLLATVFFLIVVGVVIVFSSSYYQAMCLGEPTTFYLIGHAKRVTVGLVFFLAGMLIPYEKLRRLIFPSLILLLLVLGATMLFGRSAYGARRTIFLSAFGIQGSEFVRVWIVLFLANLFANHPNAAHTGKGLAFTIATALLLILLVAVQPSVSIALISFVTLFAMLIYGGARLRLLAPVVAIGAFLFLLFVLVFPHTRARIAGFISEPSYQVQQSLIAIGSGGWFGRGPGAGIQKFLFLPRIHNDFIFAHIAEEFGFVGSLIIFFCFWEIFLRGISIAYAIQDDYARLAVLGLNASIFTIFLIHVGVSIGLLPPTGIPLPFISYGGWSLSANLFAVGMILQFSRLRTS